jgi:hypothetical protein
LSLIVLIVCIGEDRQRQFSGIYVQGKSSYLSRWGGVFILDCLCSPELESFQKISTSGILKSQWGGIWRLKKKTFLCTSVQANTYCKLTCTFHAGFDSWQHELFIVISLTDQLVNSIQVKRQILGWIAAAEITPSAGGRFYILYVLISVQHFRQFFQHI